MIRQILWISLPNNPNLFPLTGRLTIDAWIKPNFVGQNVVDAILDKRDGCSGAGISYVFEIAKAGHPEGRPIGQVAFVMSNPGSGVSVADSGTTVIANDGQFHHVAATYDGSMMKVYLDGQLVGQGARTGAPVPSSDAATISRDGAECPFRANAIIDEIEFFDRALSVTEIQAIFNAGSAGKCTACTPPPANLVSWWRAEANASDSADGNNGTLMNGAAFGPGKVGFAFSFAGGTSQVRVPDAANLDITTAVTLDAWVNPVLLAACPSGFCAVVAKGNWPASRNYGLFIGTDGSVGAGYVTIGGASIFANTGPGKVPVGSFTHVAAVLNPAAGNMSIYVNGASQPVSITGGPPSSPLVTNNEPLTIGFSDPGGFRHNFFGFIDEVEVVSRALSAAEIQAIVSAGSAGKCTAPPPPAMLTLAPTTDTNAVGTQHTVTAMVKDAGGNPVAPGFVVRFSVTGANSTSGSQATDANGQASFTYTGTMAGADTISAFADTNNNGAQDVGEPGDTATKTWTPGPPATLTLVPAADTNVVGTTHCVTATVKDQFGNPVPGVIVRFSVSTAVATHATPSSGSATTDVSGQATFCYSASLPGQDAIHAFADTDGDTTQDAGEPFGDATKTWILPPSTAFCKVTISQGGSIVANNGDRASLSGNAQVSADGTSVKGQEAYQDQGPVQPMKVKSTNLTAVTCSDDLTMATVFGTATIDGSGTFVFRIDVTDLGEPGTNDTYGIILSNGYASGQKKLQTGNVQIHK